MESWFIDSTPPTAIMNSKSKLEIYVNHSDVNLSDKLWRKTESKLMTKRGRSKWRETDEFKAFATKKTELKTFHLRKNVLKIRIKVKVNFIIHSFCDYFETVNYHLLKWKVLFNLNFSCNITLKAILLASMSTHTHTNTPNRRNRINNQKWLRFKNDFFQRTIQIRFR